MAYKGDEFVLLSSDGAATPNYLPFGGFRSNSLSINGSPVDVTNKNSNGWKALLGGSGIRAFSTSGSGTVEGGDVEKDVVVRVMNSTVHDYRVVVPGIGTFTGPMIITTWSASGEHDGEAVFDITIEGAGPITFAPET